MGSPPEPGRGELTDLLNRCWMTHDGMWFYHCFQEFGIEKANYLNKAAIKYRLSRWFDSLGVKYRLSPPVERCLMLAGNPCSCDFEFIFP